MGTPRSFANAASPAWPFAPMPRGGVFSTRAIATLSTGFRSSRRYASTSFTSRRA